MGSLEPEKKLRAGSTVATDDGGKEEPPAVKVTDEAWKIPAMERAASDEAWQKELGVKSTNITYFIKGGKAVRETVFADRNSQADPSCPRMLVSSESVRALNEVNTTLAESNEELKRILSLCRAAYLRELTFLREKVNEADGKQNKPPPLEEEEPKKIDTEVYFYDEIQYLDEDTKQILRGALKRGLKACTEKI